ncbi:MAG TPA: TRAP transporter large permease subunit [Syntrophales bacterium]|nr:TRAP transporter large permease subunit [Syntrophales bacterium]HPI57736.1 TRAP transporter large permease subunit [Syntrophales bacterium]HQM30374.1 TRAP transporter large permease subunit [Syntrophales bacterium]
MQPDLGPVSATIVGLLILFLGGSVWIGISLFLVGIGGFFFFSEVSFGSILSNVAWNNTSGSAMMALPFFIWMGEILFRSRISSDLFRGLAPWMDAIPGRLVHVNVLACTFFAAVSGSSAATTATVGKITVPELERRGYDHGLSMGSLAGAGTLGFMIPPSMMMLVYGIIGDVSIGKLFIAGFIPGFMIASMFSAYILIRCLITPELAPKADDHHSWADRIRAIPAIAPVVILVFMVLGSIYMGWATPTEAGAVGVVGALFFAALTRSLSWDVFRVSLINSVKTSCMIMLIVMGASYLSNVMGFLGITRALTEFVVSMKLSPYMLIFYLTILYLVLGCLVDGFSMIVMTAPLVLPLIEAAKFDPVWFGIYLVVMIELAQVTPPVGFNLFVISGLSNDDLLKIAKATLPFFFLMLLATVLLTAFPEIALYLPSKMK